MPSRKVSLAIALGSALLFSLLYLAPFFTAAEAKIYDAFLRLAPRREHIDNVVFLDVDDTAIAKVGVFPWPRRIMADGLLWLKEFNAELAVFDIEYIDKSPAQVDEVYLEEGLARDYDRHFSEIGSAAADILGAVGSGSIPPKEAASYLDDLTELIGAERDALFRDTMKLSGNDDLLLSRAAALFGRAWGTLNLQDGDLGGEQAERRPRAEERFSYNVKNEGGVAEGENADLLPPIVSFMEAVSGAGFTNVVIDPDGVRRRIFLTQEVKGRWYLQLAFAPLMASWGSPAISAEPRRLVIQKPGEKIVVPLDARGAMMLDWPPETYEESFDHISFAALAVLEEYQDHLIQYLSALEFSNENLFPLLPENAGELLAYYTAALAAKDEALDNCSEAAFAEYVSLRKKALQLTGEFTLSARNYIETESKRAAESAADPLSRAILEEAEYCGSLVDYIDTELNAFDAVYRELRDKLDGKMCVIGQVNTGTTDIGVNPFHGKYVNVGTHAVVWDTILSAAFINPLPVYWSVLWCFLVVPLIILASGSAKSSLRIALGIGGVLFCLGFPLGLFVLKKIFLGPLGPVLAMTAAVVVRETLAFAGSEREKQFIRKAFSTYVSGDVVKELIADPSRLQLGGAKRRMTALFTDIRNFSGIAEQLDPEDLVRLLNRYLSAMSDVILDEKGTIDKYEGDAIVSFFGAPLEIPDHALRACLSAVAMKRIEQQLNKTIGEQKLSPAPLLTRIGISTGNMVAGNMGTENKMNYTIMGNAVNLAARLEGVNKQYGTWILAPEETVRETDNRLLVRKLDRVRVVGINEPVRLYELLETAEDAAPQQKRLVEVFHQALDCFESRSWNQAAEGFTEALSILGGDAPAQKFLDRCADCIADPPPDTWDGVYNLTEK
ncbi:MAG: CHASE2 domain-containing protein [Treponema sp.]|jgi:adenylate cyclase|nr:CHASE2 domain-containing protein [Treponema sp.]